MDLAERQRELEQIVMACLPDPLARLAERGCEPPYEVALLDEEGKAAIGLIDWLGIHLKVSSPSPFS
jgi:hypothetical protein